VPLAGNVGPDPPLGSVRQVSHPGIRETMVFGTNFEPIPKLAWYIQVSTLGSPVLYLVHTERYLGRDSVGCPSAMIDWSVFTLKVADGAVSGLYIDPGGCRTGD